METPMPPAYCKQITGIEPASPAWEAGVLPMNYICEKGLVSCANDNIIAYPPEKSRAKTRKCENPEMRKPGNVKGRELPGNSEREFPAEVL